MGEYEGLPPRFPVRDPNPSMAKTIASMSTSDLLKFGTIVGLSVPFGYFTGGNVRRSQIFATTFVGGLGGFALAVQSSFQRLTGYRE
mmetsp:Transcript_13935/g.20663  ORF Transcript_13935/g.20663 Transcript_13935/m.20663 type:complete len:87 (+) Transcript_13935:231-491(+)